MVALEFTLRPELQARLVLGIQFSLKQDSLEAAALALLQFQPEMRCALHTTVQHRAVEQVAMLGKTTSQSHHL